MKNYKKFKYRAILSSSALIIIFELFRHKFMVGLISHDVDFFISTILFIVGAIVVGNLVFNKIEKLEKTKYKKEREAKQIFDASIDGIFVFNEKGYLSDMNPGAQDLCGLDEREHFTSKHVMDLIKGDTLIENFKSGYKEIKEGSLRKGDGTNVPVSYSITQLDYDDPDHNMVVTVRDLSSRKEMENVIKTLYQETAQKQYETEMLYKISREILSIRELAEDKKTQLEGVLELIKKLLQAESTGIVIREKTKLKYIASTRHDESRADFDNLSFNESLSDEFVFHVNGEAVQFYSLESKGNIIGYLYLIGENQLQSITLKHIRNTLAISLENVLQYERLRNVAILEERDRLSRELHDGLAQAISSMHIASEQLKYLLHAEELTNRKQIDQIFNQLQDMIDRSFNEIRQYLFDLRFTNDVSGPITQLLSKIVKQYHKNSNCHINYHSPKENEKVYFSEYVKMHIIRIIQEVLINIQKHAKASTIDISFSPMEEEIVIRIKDDGVGFEKTSKNSDDANSYGLKTIDERAELIKGTVEIISSIGSGTEVVLTVPFVKGDKNE
ncbi:histidine kinase [Alkalihalobacillus macyae]|uniref:sensor histidine kinase n=1 Tax=Guptibacillus hwajinpoensis TaxID=208199 RepID=UPI00273A9645|nr:histidine kinase [Alkalihalobacillus macyae]MDP4552333.1 histidine kinase [Alkalihalobacillus macyae]